ncbi:MAG: stage III sporulation protein AD [Roseburia sp.]|nr:stage III sporulation protein AD [Roseburia sp.]
MGKIALVAVAGMTLAIVVGGMRREISIWITIVSGIIIFFFGISKFEYVVDMFHELTAYTGISETYIKIIFKMIGIAYLSEFTASVCRDAGQGAIAGQVDFFGRMSMIVVSLPVLKSLLETIGELVP